MAAGLLALPLTGWAQDAPAAPAAPDAPAAPAAPAMAAAAADAPAPAAATPDEAKAFLGDWVIAVQAPDGPANIALSLTTADGKVVGKISSSSQAETVITDITRDGASLLLRYTFDYQGMSIPTNLWLTPDADKVNADFSFADGQFEMPGVGTRKKG
jgi:hypothetical protein